MEKGMESERDMWSVLWSGLCKIRPNDEKVSSSLDGVDIHDLIMEASEKRVRIEMVLEPAEGGGLRHEINVEPWEPFKATCPYGKDV